MEELHHAAAHLQQLWDDGQHFWVADVDGIVPVGLFLVADVSQMEDGRQQGEDPGERDQQLSGLLVMETLDRDLLDSWKSSLNLKKPGLQNVHLFFQLMRNYDVKLSPWLKEEVWLFGSSV